LTEAAADCAIYLPLLEQLTSTGFGELAAIDSPVQIAWGTKDRILPWPAYAERFRRMVPGAQWVPLDGLGPLPDARRRTAHDEKRSSSSPSGRDVGSGTQQPAAVEGHPPAELPGRAVTSA